MKKPTLVSPPDLVEIPVDIDFGKSLVSHSTGTGVTRGDFKVTAAGRQGGQGQISEQGKFGIFQMKFEGKRGVLPKGNFRLAVAARLNIDIGAVGPGLS